MIVRRIHADEGEQLKLVRLAALRDTPSAFGSTHDVEAGHPDEAWADRARAGAEGIARVTFVAVDDRADDDAARFVGLVGGYRDDGGELELVSMWTAPTHRRLGVGRNLVDAVLAWAAAAGAERVSLWVTRGNEPAQRLYESMGFVPTGDHQPLPSDPCKDELRMTRHLG